MARPVCSCGMVMYSDGGYFLCLHCEQAPQVTITSCNSCRVYHYQVDKRVAAEYEAEAKRV